ncbi:MAG: PEP-CTERM sorting domain-containing protein [Spartobacteria bacterium]|nr:PEP-CTERM sorting domain-containing protein [Spartobacteria bacterium]
MKKICLIAGTIMLGAGLCANANLLNNPGFEEEISWDWNSGSDVTNWNAWAGAHRVDGSWKTPQEGSQSFVLRNWEGAGGGLEQKPGVDAETVYDFSAWRLTDNGFDGTVSLTFDWLDASYASLGASDVYNLTVPSLDDTWEQFSLSVTSAVGAANVEININNPAGGTSGTMYIDNVSFDAAVIPEPATALLLVLGCGSLAWFRKKRRG